MSEKLIEKLNIGGNSFVISDSAAIKLINIGDKTHLPVEGVVDLDLKDMVVTAGEVVKFEEDLQILNEAKSWKGYSNQEEPDLVLYIHKNEPVLKAGLEAGMSDPQYKTLHDGYTVYDFIVDGEVLEGKFTYAQQQEDAVANTWWFTDEDRNEYWDQDVFDTIPAGTYLKLTIANQEEPVYIDVNDIAGTLDYDTLINTPLFLEPSVIGEEYSPSNELGDPYVLIIDGTPYIVTLTDETVEDRWHGVILTDLDGNVVYKSEDLNNIHSYMGLLAYYGDIPDGVMVARPEDKVLVLAGNTPEFFNNKTLEYHLYDDSKVVKINPVYQEFFAKLGSHEVELTQEEYDALVEADAVKENVTYFITDGEGGVGGGIDDTVAAWDKTYSSKKIQAMVDSLTLIDDENISEETTYSSQKIEETFTKIDNDNPGADTTYSGAKIKAMVDAIPAQQPANWNETDETSPTFIENKPDVVLREEYIQSDWEEEDEESMAFIKNKPDLGNLDDYVKYSEDRKVILASDDEKEFHGVGISLNDEDSVLINAETSSDVTTSTATAKIDAHTTEISHESSSLDGLTEPEKQSIVLKTVQNTASNGTRTATVAIEADYTTNEKSTIRIEADEVSLSGTKVTSNGGIIDSVVIIGKNDYDALVEAGEIKRDVSYFIEDANPEVGMVTYTKLFEETDNINFNTEL